MTLAQAFRTMTDEQLSHYVAGLLEKHRDMVIKQLQQQGLLSKDLVTFSVPMLTEAMVLKIMKEEL